MGSVKLYGLVMSVYTARVMATLEELGVAYTVVQVNSLTGESKKPPHRARNPFGQIPALQDGDLTLFESRAISRYLSRKYKNPGAPDLLGEGRDGVAETMVNMWMVVEGQQYHPAISAVVNQLIAEEYGRPRNDELRAKNVANLARVLDVYEERLGRTEYLAGDFFSLADLHHLPHTHYLTSVSPYASLITSRARVRAWWETLSSRSACKKVTGAMDAASAAWAADPKNAGDWRLRLTGDWTMY